MVKDASGWCRAKRTAPKTEHRQHWEVCHRVKSPRAADTDGDSSFEALRGFTERNVN